MLSDAGAHRCVHHHALERLRLGGDMSSRGLHAAVLQALREYGESGLGLYSVTLLVSQSLAVDPGEVADSGASLG
jgi:hypothetical protein